ncbi:major facilitator superfamily transporter sugar [Kockovaella imperatae]|uniref:Major facilitator superfamily transporter sugar n=1 Tax=Kockovaella imperatae TaxID=4999 RepID=A0A1Y1UBH1_9TREE|nr:major facilitator superfamily transporter sugar [Kockovaella imperatae]ORX34867.1 major facilitator superfamily transporter sugar [Kockovaella imperatae]
MGATTYWKSLSPAKLNFWIQAFSLIAIFFEGYDQGVMGGVNSSPDYVTTVKIGEPDGRVTDVTKQGGIVSVYYLGAIFGCFAGGWLADRVGRINGTFCASFFAMIGGALQAATQSAAMIIVARIITGIGTGALTAIIPVYVSETSTSHGRGRFLGLVFIANYLGIAIAYWLDFGLSFVKGPNGLAGTSSVRWRFLLAFQCFPAILLALGIKLLPDSPRYYISSGQKDKALEVLTHVRGSRTPSAEIDREFKEMVAVSSQVKPANPFEFTKILFGRSDSPAPHLARRAWLCLWLQIMASYTAITAVTAYAPILLSAAGYSMIKQNGLAGGLSTVGIVGTIISAYVVDRFGRRRCLMAGALGLVVVNAVAGGLYEASRRNSDSAARIAPAAVTMLFLFNLIYASTWGTVAFLIPTEIFPSEMRAQGNGFGVTGWAIGVGTTTLANPSIFAQLQNRAYFLFAGLNLLWIIVVWLFYPETKDRSLEAINILFIPSSPLNAAAEKSWREHGDGDVLHHGPPASDLEGKYAHQQIA